MKQLIFLILISLNFGIASGKTLQLDLPALTSPVIDQAQILSLGTIKKLETRALQLRDNDIIQLQILTLKSLNGLPIEQASIQIVDRWKLGSKTKDNGVLFLIVPLDRQMRIEVGRGLEGGLTDAASKRIISDIVTPYFKDQRFDEGVLAGATAIIRAVDPTTKTEQTETSVSPPSAETKGTSLWVIGLFLLMFIIRPIFSFGFFGLGYRRGGGHRGNLGGNWTGGGGSFNGGGASGKW